MQAKLVVVRSEYNPKQKKFIRYDSHIVGFSRDGEFEPDHMRFAEQWLDNEHPTRLDLTNEDFDQVTRFCFSIEAHFDDDSTDTIKQKIYAAKVAFICTEIEEEPANQDQVSTLVTALENKGDKYEKKERKNTKDRT